MEQHKIYTNDNGMILSLNIKITILMVVLIAATIMITSYLSILSEAFSARLMIFMAAGLITFGAAGTVIFAHNLTRPIHRLVEAAQKVSAGNFNQYVEPTTKDEIGFLTTTFNQMVNGLKERQKLENELMLAREIQSNLLPQIPSDLEGFEIAALNIPSNSVRKPHQRQRLMVRKAHRRPKRAYGKR